MDNYGLIEGLNIGLTTIRLLEINTRRFALGYR